MTKSWGELMIHSHQWHMEVWKDKRALLDKWICFQILEKQKQSVSVCRQETDNNGGEDDADDGHHDCGGNAHHDGGDYVDDDHVHGKEMQMLHCWHWHFLSQWFCNDDDDDDYDWNPDKIMMRMKRIVFCCHSLENNEAEIIQMLLRGCWQLLGKEIQIFASLRITAEAGNMNQAVWRNTDAALKEIQISRCGEIQMWPCRNTDAASLAVHTHEGGPWRSAPDLLGYSRSCWHM